MTTPKKERIAETVSRQSTVSLTVTSWQKLFIYWQMTELRMDEGIICLTPPPMASVNRSDGFMRSSLPCIPDVTLVKVELKEPVLVLGCDGELSIISKETETPILDIVRATDESEALTERLRITERESPRRSGSSESNLPQRLFVPAIIMPDGGIVHAPISDAGVMAIPAFDSQPAVVNWLQSGGEVLILPIESKSQLPGGRVGIVDTTPEKLKDGIPSIGGRKRVVHLNPRSGISPDDQTVDL